MENYQMNYAGCRPDNRTGGITNAMQVPHSAISGPVPVRPPHCVSKIEECNSEMPRVKSKNAEMYTHLAHLEAGYGNMYPASSLRLPLIPIMRFRWGILPELCKPFCGKRGGRR